jgi:xylan 1,4-beta-xylosidase
MRFMKKIQIRVDAGNPGNDLKHGWRYIGYDECNYTQAPEGRELLRKFGQLEDAPYYVRTHHLFCTGNCHGTYKWGSTNVYREDGQGNPIYDWEVVDDIIDILLENNLKPFFELGFMPMDLISDELYQGMNDWEKFGNYKEKFWSYPPKDYKKWYDLVYQLVTHCVEKYGENEVLTWYWELWNEPDIFYWRGTFEEFCMLFDYTEAAIHAVLNSARLGGPATTGPQKGSSSLEFLNKFLKHCAGGKNYYSGETGTRLDYVTFHVKGGAFPFHPEAPKATPSLLSYTEQVKLGLEAIRDYGFGDLEVVLSEADPDGWAAGGMYDNRNMNFRNTEYYASFVAASYHMIKMLAKEMRMDVRPLAWAFMFVGERCFEGTRTFSTQGIDKAVFNMFKAYAKMGSKELSFCCTGDKELLSYKEDFVMEEAPLVSGMAATDDRHSIQVMVFSHHDDWDTVADQEVEVTIENYSFSGKIRLKHYRIDNRHSNAYTEWMRQGKPKYPVGMQYEEIKAKDTLELLYPEETWAVQEGRVHVKFSLPAHAISLIEISPEE